MSDEQLIRAYMTHRTIKGAAQAMGIANAKAGARLRRLRRAGVRIPRFSYAPIEQADIDKLNDLLRGYE